MESQQNKLSPWATGVITGVLIGIAFVVAIVAVAIYFGA
jgi:hypothetical protein